MADHVVRRGDCLCSIARAHGFYNYKTIYQHGDNAALRNTRANPNMLVEGDVVKIPDKTAKKVALTLNGTTRFVVKRVPTKLFLVVQDSEGKALEPTKTTLVVGSLKSTTAPSQRGALEYEIPPDATSGTLTLILPAVPKKAPPKVAATAAANPPAHPPPIKTTEFIDKMAERDHEKLEIEFSLRIGHLEPASENRGVTMRLNNLGFDLPPKKNEDDDSIAAVKTFQGSKKKTKTGKIADARADVEAAHDRP
jgi:hypothetical protein